MQSYDWLDVVLGNAPLPEKEPFVSTLPPISPDAEVTYTQYHSQSWVAYIGRQAIDEGMTEGDLLKRLAARGCHNPTHKPFKIVIIK